MVDRPTIPLDVDREPNCNFISSGMRLSISVSAQPLRRICLSLSLSHCQQHDKYNMLSNYEIRLSQLLVAGESNALHELGSQRQMEMPSNQTIFHPEVWNISCRRRLDSYGTTLASQDRVSRLCRLNSDTKFRQ